MEPPKLKYLNIRHSRPPKSISEEAEPQVLLRALLENRKRFLKLFGVLILSGGLILFPWTQEGKDALDRYHAGLKLMKAGQYKRAVEEFQKLISNHPDFSRAYRSLERAFVLLDDLPGLRTYLANLLEETPENPYINHALGRVASEVDDCIDYCKKAITLDETFAAAYRDLAYFYNKKGTPQEAIHIFQKQISENPENGNAYFGLGYTYVMQNKWSQALEALQKAIEIDPEHSQAYNYMIVVYGRTGRYTEVLEISSKLIKASTIRNEFENIAYAHLVMGNSYQYLGDYWRALHHYNQSLKMTREVGEKGREGAALTGIGNIYANLGEFERALEFYQAAHRFAKSARDNLGEVIALSNIGLNLIRAGNPQMSLDYLNEAIEIARSEGYRNEECNLVLNKAAAHERLGDRETAVEEYKAALQLAKKLDDPANEGAILIDLGNIEIKRSRYTDATDYFNQARTVADKAGNVQFLWSSKGGLGKVSEHLGEKKQAVTHYAEAVDLYDNARKLGISSMGTGFLELHENVYPPIIQLLAEAGQYKEAFSYAQRYKSASLLQVLSEGRNVIDELLPERFRSDLNEIREKLETTHTEMAAARTHPEKDESKIQILEQQLVDLELRWAFLLGEIQREEGSYYQLMSAEPSGLEDIRFQGLSPQQTLVEYIVGEKKLSVFILTHDDFSYREIPVTQERLEQMLADLSPVLEKHKEMDEVVRSSVFTPELADFSIPSALALYNVLIKPIEPLLAEGTELIVVPDGLLFYLPFETLIVDAADAEHRYDFEKVTFLVEKYAVSYIASASLLVRALRRSGEAEQGLLAFGNPDFNRSEGDRLPREFFDSNLAYSGGIVRGDELLPLPAAEVEVDAIADALGSTESRIYVGKQATETLFKKDATNYRFLHLATHFLSDDRQPLYSKIVLALDPKSEEDGYLQTYEIFNTRLNADLVVLSACNTGLGKLSKGEGLVGVSRAFLYAGAPSLVVSLWSVDDVATSILMESFYRHLREGFNKNQALRKAKLEYLESARGDRRNPFFWAPFILIGDWRPLSFSDPMFPYLWLVVIALVVAFVSGFVWKFRRRAHMHQI